MKNVLKLWKTIESSNNVFIGWMTLQGFDSCEWTESYRRDWLQYNELT